MNIHQGIINNRTVLFLIQVVSLIIIGFIIWMAVRSFRQYKNRYVDPEKNHLIATVDKMREVNTRLTKRNQDLAEQVAELRRQLSDASQTTDTVWYR